MMSNDLQTAVALVFQKGPHIRTIVTDGRKVAIYKPNGRTFVRSMGMAIAHLECKGYRINMQETSIS